LQADKQTQKEKTNMRILNFLSLGLLLGIYTSSFASKNSNTKDSLRNEITISQDRLGYYDCSIKYSHKLTSNLWLKSGLIVLGNNRKYEPNSLSTSYPASSKQSSFGIIFGLDKHSSSIVKGLNCVYGVHLRFFFGYDKEFSDNPALPKDLRTVIYQDYSAGVGFTLGLYYNFSEKFAIGSELNPYLAYTDHNSDNDYNSRTRGYTYDLFGNISIISIKFKW